MKSATFLLVGCQGNRRTFGGRQREKITVYEDISAIVIMLKKPLLDLDDDGYYDGVHMWVYLKHPGDDKFVAGEGSMVFRLLRRVKGEKGQPVDKELKVWKIPPDGIKRALGYDNFGLLFHRIELFWQDHSDDEDGFIIQRKPYQNSDQWYEIDTVGANVTAYTDTDLLHGLVEYTYRVGSYKQ